jgi:hypothetical protein
MSEVIKRCYWYQIIERKINGLFDGSVVRSPYINQTSINIKYDTLNIRQK